MREPTWGHRTVHASCERIEDPGLVTCHVLRAELLDLRSPGRAPATPAGIGFLRLLVSLSWLSVRSFCSACHTAERIYCV